jgi:hypothetical protein
VSLPSVTSSVSFGAGHFLHWVVLPRLEASGWVAAQGRRLTLERELAYHDHNWGRFRWGGDLAWEWGFVHAREPSSAWSVVVLRVSDGGRHRSLSQAVLVWRGARLVRTFQNAELGLSLSATHRGPRPLTLPKIASLLLPGTSSGVPGRFAVEAAGHGDRLALEFETTSKARVAIPSERDPFGLVVLNETSGPAHVRGVIEQEAFDFSGTALMEFVRG